MTAGDLPDDWESNLRRIASAGTEVIEPFMRILNERPQPKTLYHYTNDVGLKGILESGKLWLTDVFDMNDPSEISHGISFAVEHLTAKSAGAPYPVTFFADVFARFPQDGVRASAHYFVCSLSSDGDDLGQWRSYGDDGRGYALGFDADTLAKVFHRDDQFACSSFPVTYEDAQLTRMQAALVDSAFPFLLPAGLAEVSSEVQRGYYTELGTALPLNVLAVALLFKHEAYRNESEYRLLKMRRADEPPPGVKLRAHRNSVGRYVELDWRAMEPTALSEFVIGPTAQKERAHRFLNDCILLSRHSIGTIRESTIPYRGR